MKRLFALIITVIYLLSGTVFAGPEESFVELITDRLPEKSQFVTYANGHYYNLYGTYDDREEMYRFYLMEDDRKVADIKTNGPRGIVQINSTVYVASERCIYYYDPSSESLIVYNNWDESEYGFIDNMFTNGVDLYVATDWHSDIVWNSVGFDATVRKVTSWSATKVTSFFARYMEYGVGISRDGKAVSYVPEEGTGTRVSYNGSSYIQRTADIKEFPGDYKVDNVIYYNNCLIANVFGSLVYYDEDNKRQLLVGDLAGNNWSHSLHQLLPGSLPVKTGGGDETKVGYITQWTIGDDGCIYAHAMIDGGAGDTPGRYELMKITIPDYVKNTVTYRKTGQ